MGKSPVPVCRNLGDKATKRAAMPRLYLPAERLESDSITVEGEPHRYLTRVLRLSRGDALVIFDGVGAEIEARVRSTSPRATTLALGARRAVALPSVAITLIQAVPRGGRMDLVVQKTTELGVTRIVPVVTVRSVMEPRSEGRLQRWRTIANEAARQCGRADVPVVETPQALPDALSAAAEIHARLLLQEGTRGAPLRGALAGQERAVALAVGPEGGFSPEESAAAQSVGFRPVGLGPRVLRAETAAIVAVALVQAALGGLE
jgi:16S rRNA (uracil1498-N3)-methyltransferase